MRSAGDMAAAAAAASRTVRVTSDYSEEEMTGKAWQSMAKLQSGVQRCAEQIETELLELPLEALT